MAYQKQSFVNNLTVLTAEMLEHIENGIVANEDSLKAIAESLKNLSVNTASSPIRVSHITVYANKWVGTASPFTQVVTVDGVTASSQVNIKLSAEQIELFRQKDITFSTENDGGVVTVFCVGQKPTADYTIQVNIMEVVIDG